ncbi:hypothetical protein ACFOZ5_00715 [Marinobacter lacisalsi]|uniref:Uncharacterized protein n=1 Tax=Marinobacter lacisalsi TaxID=475979 RepID=A0ABV8QDG1_9GAMM
MSTRKSGRIWRPALLLLTLPPGWALGDQSVDDSFSLVLEVRYCECAVINPDGPQGALPKGFLEDSNLLRADVADDGSGSVSSDDVSLTFKVQDVEDSPGTYRFNYSGSYTSGTGDSSSQADLILTEGQWVPLAQTGHDDEALFGVAARLVDPG